MLGPYRETQSPGTLSTTRLSSMRLRLADGDSCFLPLEQLDRSSCRSAQSCFLAPLRRFWGTLSPTFSNISSEGLRLS